MKEAATRPTINKRAIIAILIFVTLSAMPYLLHYKNMNGYYVANYGRGKDTLILLNDATFLQHYTDSSGKQYTNTGTWAREHRDFLELSNYIFYAPPFAHSYQPQFWGTAYHKSWFKTTITVQEDSNYYYLKVK